MNKYFITFLCASVAFSVFAGVSRLSRSALKNATINVGNVMNVSSESSKVSPLSPQQDERERRFLLNDKRSGSNSIMEMMGAKIASVDAYNFDWDNESCTAQIIYSSCAMMGKHCKLTSCSSSFGNILLSCFYGDFEIPCNLESTTGVFTIKTCEPLCQLYSASNGSTYKLSNSAKEGTHWTLYAVPQSWLMGDDNCDGYIYGQVNDNGTISLSDDFALVVETVNGDKVDWSLSPIFKNLTLLTPNGTHEFDCTRLSSVEDPYQDGLGCGGLVPRPHKPGSSKPISTGPVSPRPIAPRPNSINACSTLNTCALVTTTTHELQPVYMYWADATTLTVYNLFGMGLRCNMEIDKNDGTMQLAQQQIFNNGLGLVLYNRSCSGIGSQDSVTWNLTETIGSVSVFSPEFNSNVLRFTGDSTPFTEPSAPIFEEAIVCDTTVTFRAITEDPGMEVKLYIYVYHEEEQTEEYLEVDNPLTVPRLTWSYWIDLVAETYNPVTGMRSNSEWFWYEVPALVTGPVSGDVNGDGVVSSADVTTLYNSLLGSDVSAVVNGDQDGDGIITAADITIIYSILLGE